MLKRLVTLLLWITALALGVFLLQTGLIQYQKGGRNIIAVLLGDTRMLLSSKMVVLADEYYHGGVKHQDCEHGLSRHGHQKTLEHTQDEHAHQHTELHSKRNNAETKQTPEKDTSFFIGWVEQINKEIRPSGHKHLHGKRYEKEILPWMWAAVKASPENVLAYQVSSFWLADKLGKTEQALKLLEKGIEHNPDSYKLELSRAQIFFDPLQNYEKTLSAARKALAKWKKKHGGQPEKPRSKSELLDHQHILTLLVESNRRLGELQTARSRAKQALEVHPDNEYFKKIFDNH